MSVTWNGTTLSGPVLIYQDELVVDTNGPLIDGTLECRSDDQIEGVTWLHPTGGISHSDQNFIQQGAGSAVSRLSVKRQDINTTSKNGLFTCRLSALSHTSLIFVAVGIYARMEGKILVDS